MAQLEYRSARTATARRGRRTGMAAAALMVGGLVAAACGSSSPGSTSASNSGSTSTSSPAASGKATVAAAKEPGVGTVLVDSAGHTLYVFSKDAQKSVTCTGGCQAIWPPLTVSGTPVAGAGVTSSMLGTVTSGGKTVVTYDHWPLYTFAQDSGPDQAHGQGIKSFGGSWSTLRANGQLGGQSSTSGSTTSSTSVYGY